MRRDTRLSVTLAIALLATAVTAAAAGDMPGIVDNSARIVAGNGAAAAANCQLLVLADATVVSGSFHDALGVVRDGDDVGAAPASVSRVVDRSDSSESTASCAQDVGEILVRVARSAGWGAAAEADGGWSWASGIPSSVTVGEPALGGDARPHVASNRVSVHLSGAAPASAASCQLLVAADLFVVSAAHHSSAAAASVEQEAPPVAGEGTLRDSRASCHELVGLVEIVLAD